MRQPRDKELGTNEGDSTAVGTTTRATELERQGDSTRNGKLIAVLSSIAGLSLLGAIVVSLRWTEQLPDVPLHSVCEATSGFACLTVAILLLLLRRCARNAYLNMLPPATGLLSMGVLDLFHASVPFGDVFIWLRVCASAAGGVGFALLVLPERLVHDKRAEIAPPLFFVGALVIGVLSITFHRLLPPMMAQAYGGFTDVARAICAGSGTLFLLAFVTIVTGRRPLPRTEVRFLSSFCLLQALACYLFVESGYWTASWWLWHFLRVIAAVVLVAHALRIYATLQAQLSEALAAHDRFLSCAAHDLKTPLTAIRLNVEVLMRRAELGGQQTGALITDAKARAGTLLAQIDRLVVLVNDLLDVSMLRSGKLKLHRGSADLSEIVRRTLDELEPFLSARCPVETDLAPGLLGDWDAGRISQVLTNLLTNATKFGAGKPIRVQVARVGGRARLTVGDSGIGIAKSDQSRIFSCFERAVPTTAYGGLGLGLYISREVVEAHKGTIRVESEPGKGSTFVVELPCHGVALPGAVPHGTYDRRSLEL
jgi:signal transduction histidine kinase